MQKSHLSIIGSQTLVNGLAKELGLKTTVPYRARFEGKQVDMLCSYKFCDELLMPNGILFLDLFFTVGWLMDTGIW